MEHFGQNIPDEAPDRLQRDQDLFERWRASNANKQVPASPATLRFLIAIRLLLVAGILLASGFLLWRYQYPQFGTHFLTSWAMVGWMPAGVIGFIFSTGIRHIRAELSRL